MVLSDAAILKDLKNGRIRIKPSLSIEHLRPAGIRVHLGPKLLIPYAGQLVDLANPTELHYDNHDLDVAPYVLEPNSFVLASTRESLHTAPDLLSILEGRSTIARLGVAIHNAASILDGTHFGWLKPVLEIANHGNMRVVLRTGIPIGMICFHQLNSPVSQSTYHNQYAMQADTTPPILNRGACVLSST